MAVFKCKMCGGTLDVNENFAVAECEYCCSKQTIPTKKDEIIANLFNRANNLRLKSEFDRAAEVYNSILNEDDSDAEAHWGLVLCKYGIEYVEDPKTHTRIPTCHRTQYTSVLSDADYLAAIENADAESKSLYTSEAHAIAELQKSILAIVKDEKPFDVFICYKETDENGKRTVDSALANDIYYQLTKEGLRVFYAAITLEDKLGVEYEPYIFAALNSAKVMLVIGTKPEYFNAVWVKNEWSRYLGIMKLDREKILIPCYRDIDAYDLPGEFAHFQALDMSKIGFVNDLVRGIMKVVIKEEAKPTVVNEPVVAVGGANVTALLKRVFMFLEDADWKSADEYCEKVLDIDPECAEAYLGKLMVQERARSRANLKNCAEPFDGNNNYQKAIRFGDDKLKVELTGYIDYIKSRNERIRVEGIYSEAVSTMSAAVSEKDFEKAVQLFKSIPGWKDADESLAECKKRIKELRIQAEIDLKDGILAEGKGLMDTGSISDYEEAIECFKEIPGWKDANESLAECKKRLKELRIQAETDRKDNIFADGKELMDAGTISDYEKAVQLFESIPGWKDADESLAECKKRIEALRIQAEIDQKDRLLAERKAMAKKKGITICSAVTVAVVLAIVIVVNAVIVPGGKYKDAMALMGDGKTLEALTILNGLGNYKDAETKRLELWDEIAVRETISAKGFCTVGLKSDGTLVAVGDNEDGQINVESWIDIVAISTGGYHTVALESDGTVLAVGENWHDRCDVTDWTDIVAVSAGAFHTVGLRSDGTVVVTGASGSESEWTDIVAISAGDEHTVGLKSDGTVVATGGNYAGQCDVTSWTDIVAISAGDRHTVGLKSDGTVVATEIINEEDEGQCDVTGWTDIVAISAGYEHTVGLKSDGTVVAVGDNYFAQCDVADWTDIVAVSAGNDHTVGLRSDGTVVATAYSGSKLLYKGQCDVADWKDIKVPTK